MRQEKIGELKENKLFKAREECSAIAMSKQGHTYHLGPTYLTSNTWLSKARDDS